MIAPARKRRFADQAGAGICVVIDAAGKEWNVPILLNPQSGHFEYRFPRGFVHSRGLHGARPPPKR